MARSRLLLIGFIIWFALFFTVQSLDRFGIENVEFDLIIFLLGPGLATVILAFPDLSKRPKYVFLLAVAAFAIVRPITLEAILRVPLLLAIETLLLLATVYISRLVSLALANLEQIIENVVANSSASRILSMAEGEEHINNELFRARRYDRPVSFILLRITSLEGMRPKSSERFNLEVTFQRRYLQLRIAHITVTTLYRSDIIAWNTDNLVICLPETNREEAVRQATLIHDLILLYLNVDVPIGVAMFPKDGLIYRDVVDAALLNRLNFAKQAQTPTVASPPPAQLRPPELKVEEATKPISQ